MSEKDDFEKELPIPENFDEVYAASLNNSTPSQKDQEDLEKFVKTTESELDNKIKEDNSPITLPIQQDNDEGNISQITLDGNINTLQKKLKDINNTVSKLSQNIENLITKYKLLKDEYSSETQKLEQLSAQYNLTFQELNKNIGTKDDELTQKDKLLSDKNNELKKTLEALESLQLSIMNTEKDRNKIIDELNKTTDDIITNLGNISTIVDAETQPPAVVGGNKKRRVKKLTKKTKVNNKSKKRNKKTRSKKNKITRKRQN
jgi:chromosome segregation ATPase